VGTNGAGTNRPDPSGKPNGASLLEEALQGLRDPSRPCGGPKGYSGGCFYMQPGPGKMQRTLTWKLT